MSFCGRAPELARVKVNHHSDRVNQYCSHAFQEKLREYVMTCSMSRKGNFWDNAPTESYLNSMKNERVYATRAEAMVDLFKYIEVFYNRKRRHSTLENQQNMASMMLASWNTKIEGTSPSILS